MAELNTSDGLLIAAAILLASGKFTTEDAADAVRCLAAVLRCAPLRREGADVPF